MSRSDLTEAEARAAQGEARLWLVSTPIGNLEDMSPRAARILGEADAIACEDTRVTRKLLDHLGIENKRLLACHDHNEAASAGGVVKLIEKGASVALVSDAGTPAVSDPGYRVVRAVLDAGFEVSAAPGPSAVLTALAVSGLPTDRFTFVGFAPRKPGKRTRLFEDLAASPASLIVMESPQRLADTLQAAREAFGDRQAAVAFELTKTFERVHRDVLSALITRYDEAPRGEATIVIAGAKERRERVNKYAPDGGKTKR
ncbi:MAG: 16S rRNA (cytidine(1402)-2'-O)-methyltransferase [Pseudomonadota bacterium]